MIGNAHIDPVWLWRWQEGVDEALATFRSAADRCDEYPDFIFTRGEAWLYRQVERLDPPLFERVRGLVERGQWHVTGGQYLQPDANLPTVMGWRRQLLHGRRYFRERFGIIPRVGYNVDSFGHPATLPDVLAQLGYVGYVFHRPGAHQVTLPAPAFRWRGPGGGEVIGFRITPSYVTLASDLYGQIMLSVESADPAVGHTMCFYGVGNHGGGPTRAHIEYILEHARAFPDVELRFSTPQVFFQQVGAAQDRLPVVTEELQHTFPGCYSVMHDIKQRQISTEHLLDQSQRLVEDFEGDAHEQEALAARLSAAWDDLLFTEFHDILAGTSIPSAWESVRAMQGRARIIGEEVALDVTRRWARRALPPANFQQLVVVNPDEDPWAGMIEAEPWLDWELWGQRWLSDVNGEPLEYQRVQPETHINKTRILVPLQIAARGHAQILVRDDPPPTRDTPTTDLEATSGRLANGRLQVELDSSGIAGLVVDGRQILGEEGIRLHLRRDTTDTWTFHTDRFDEPVEATFAGEGWVVEETGPLRARLRLDGRLGHSAVRWTLSLCCADPRLHLQLEVNFAERFTLLQLPISLAATPTRWVDGQPGGAVERRPGPTEWPVQGWSRLDLGETQLAMVTNDVYSLSLDRQCWQWTLLRSPKMAWMGKEPPVYAGHDWHTDQGWHSFAFTLHAGHDLRERTLRSAARQQVQPPIVFSRYEGMKRPPWEGPPPRHMWMAAEERALADGRLQDLADIRGGENA